MRGERGSVLAQVLMVSLFASILCASLLRARLQPALTTARVQDRVVDDLAAQGAINRVSEVWTRNGDCASDGNAGVACVYVMGGGACGCTCVVSPFSATAPAVSVVSKTFGGACALTATRR